MWADSFFRRMAPWFALNKFAERDWCAYWERSAYSRRRSCEPLDGYVFDEYWGDWAESDAMFRARILSELSDAR